MAASALAEFVKYHSQLTTTFCEYHVQFGAVKPQRGSVNRQIQLFE